MKMFLAGLVAIACAAHGALAQDAPPRPLAIKVKRALPVSGPPIDDAVILVEGGRISAIGAASAVDIPDDADVVTGAVATPGFIHPAAVGIGPSANYDVSGRNNAADRLAADDFVPTWPFVKALAKAGFTRCNVIVSNGGFAGQSVLVKPIRKLDRPIRREDVVVTKDLSLSMGFEPRTQNKTFWKETLSKARKFRDDRAGGGRAESAPASRPSSSGDSKPSEESRPASRPAEPVADPKVTPIADVLDARMPGILVIGSAAALLHIEPILAETPQFKPAFLVLDEAWRVVDRLKKLGVPLILQPERAVRPDTIIEIVPVRDCVDAGIAVALIPESSLAAGYAGFTFHLAELGRKGVARDVLLRAVTLTPAEILGIQKEVGSLDKGKAADILVWSADPFAPEADLVRVIVGGVTVFDAKEEP